MYVTAEQIQFDKVAILETALCFYKTETTKKKK